ncbi:MAG: Hsp20/alpha crystallin family protein [Pseudomonadota bacterium]
MNLTQWTPFRELDDFLSGYRSLISRPGSTEDGTAIEGANLTWRPTSDIVESDDAFIVKAVLPDVKRDDIKVSVDEGVLRIEGERRYEKSAKDEKQHRTESLYGSFFRAFTLPKNVDGTAISANYRDGVLMVTLPKREPTAPESINIDVK